jgi:hypothetical protein
MRLESGNSCRVNCNTPPRRSRNAPFRRVVGLLHRCGTCSYSTPTDIEFRDRYIVGGQHRDGLPVVPRSVGHQARIARLIDYQGGSMSVAGVASSPILQWLQNALSSAGSAPGSPSSCGCQSSSSDTTSISQQAVQLNATQASQAPDPSQTSGVYGPQGHHHHHHHGGGQGGGSFMDQLAQSIITDLQKATGSGASVGSGSSTTGSTSSSTADGSFVDKLASKIANDLLAQYQQATGSTAPTSQSSTTNQVNVTA